MECLLAVNTLGLNDRNKVFINDKVSYYISNREWSFPQSIVRSFPSISNLLAKIHIPIEEKENACIWNLTEYGILTIKVAYKFKHVAAPILNWGKSIWNILIPPSRSLLFSRFLHQKISTDENLATRGMNVPSMCSFSWIT